jgi:hypothetical protein
MSLSFELRLEERQPDRVWVSVLLVPRDGALPIDGVAVELFSRQRESLSPRLLLPIAGVLANPMTVKVELRAQTSIPPGAMVVGTAWWGPDTQRVVCPADPWTELEAHVRGKRCLGPREERPGQDFMGLDPTETGRLAGVFPWLEARGTPPCMEGFGEPLDAFDVVDEISEELGLDAENAEWLRQLLKEDE